MFPLCKHIGSRLNTFLSDIHTYILAHDADAAEEPTEIEINGPASYTLQKWQEWRWISFSSVQGLCQQKRMFGSGKDFAKSFQRQGRDQAQRWEEPREQHEAGQQREKHQEG